VPAFGSFASFVGSTVCALLSFVLPLPELFHLRVGGHAAGATQRDVDWAILFGLAFAAHGLYDAVLSRH
jgi:proton-coupled amino acid transporter